jgi:transposase
MADAGPEPEVVIEATYGWYWIVDWLQEQGATVHLANDEQVGMLERAIHDRLRDDRGFRTIQQINRIGPTMAAILVAEIGDVHRFRNAAALCSWAVSRPSITSRTRSAARRSQEDARSGIMRSLVTCATCWLESSLRV